MSLTPQDIEKRIFRERRRGYDPEDVDAFLDEVAERIAELERQRDRAQARLAELEDSSAGARETETLLSRTLISAERTAEQTVATAKQDAERFRSEAAQEAERMQEEARREASEVIEEAKQEAEELRRSAEHDAMREREFARAGSERVRRAVVELREFREDYRERVQAVIAEQLAALDRVGDLPDLDPRIDELARLQPDDHHAGSHASTFE